jgi:hypothetical protein
MENESRISRPRKVIGSYGRNFRRVDRPFHPWEIQAAEAWKKQQEQEGHPIVIEPRKAIGGFFRKPRIYWEGLQEGQPLILRPRKVIYSYLRKPQAA